jgi:hypothetical protein
VSFEVLRVRRAAIPLAVLPCATLLLGACQSISINEGPPNFSNPKAAATLSPPSTTGNFSGPTPTTPQSTPTTEPPAEPPAGTATALATYLLKKYSTAAWYGDVTRVDSAAGKTITVQSALQPASGSRAPARAICSAVRGWQTSAGGGAGPVVIDGNGGIELLRVTKSQSC